MLLEVVMVRMRITNSYSYLLYYRMFFVFATYCCPNNCPPLYLCDNFFRRQITLALERTSMIVELLGGFRLRSP